MIQKCCNFSCFALERPYKVQYSQEINEIIDLYCNNGDIYQFKLPDCEHYEKIVNEQKIKQLRRVGDVWIILDAQRTLIVRNNLDQLYQFDNIQQIEQWNTQKYHVIIGKHSSKSKNLIVGVISRYNTVKSQNKVIVFKSYSLMEILLDNENQSLLHNTNQFLPSEYKIQKIFGNCCILSNKYNQRIVIQIQLQKIHIHSQPSIINYHRLDFELSDYCQIISIYENYLLMKQHKSWYLRDINAQRTLEIKELDIDTNYLEFIIIEHFIVVLTNMELHIYELIKGTLMSKILIASLLEESQVESCLELQQINEQARYCLVLDKLNSKLTNFYLMDKQKTAIYSINIKAMINEIVYQPIASSLTLFKEDPVHDNVIKTINFRTKKIQTLQKYLSEGASNNSYGNTIRFLLNEENIFVLNDGITLFYNFINNHLRISRVQSSALVQIQRELIKLCSKLIKQSKYESHIENGLLILNTIYAKFRSNQSVQGLQKNKQGYVKILQSNRVIKLLRQDKKKKLFQLSYELAIKIKGFKYVEMLELSSVKHK